MILYGPTDPCTKKVCMQTLLLATSNLHKLEEFRAIFSDMPLRLLSLSDIQLAIDVEETGITFAENAKLKARTYAQMSNMLTLADDSGLEIDALEGFRWISVALVFVASLPLLSHQGIFVWWKGL